MSQTLTAPLVRRTGGGPYGEHGCNTASCELWDPNTDGKHTVMWENGTMHAIVTVYWVAI